MIVKFHTGLGLERWQSIPFDKKILNIASELSRTKHWLCEKDETLANEAIERALELLDMTVEVETINMSPSFLKEFLRFREALAEFYIHPTKDYREFMILFKGLLDLYPKVHNLELEI